MRRAALAVACVLAFGGLSCGQDLPEDTNEIATLTVEQAEALLMQHPYLLSLNGLTSMTPEVAEVLAKHKGCWCLDGLTQITPEVAAILRSNDKIHFLAR
jgi:hypothetical protein